jgi:predicted nuclease of predicted toxin-antitoxin system
VHSQIRFLLDEHIPSAVAAGLARRGIDVLTVQEVGRSGFEDSEQLQFATENNRVVVTFDRDLGVVIRGVATRWHCFLRSNEIFYRPADSIFALDSCRAQF